MRTSPLTSWAHWSRPTTIALRLALVALIGLAFALFLPGAAPAHADNVTAQRISRTEVIARAQFWVYHTPSYNQTSSYDDPDGKSYRTDCSGFVSMAWHLTDAPYTGSFPSHSGVSKLASRSSLQTGDMLDNVADGHMVLFAGWDNSAHTLFTYYTFGSNPPKKVTGASFSDSTLSGWPTSHYVAYTYSKLFNDAEGTTLETPFTGSCGHTAWYTDNLTGMHDVDLSTDECYRVLTDNTGRKFLNAWITVHWRPGSDGSDDSSNNTTSKYDGFEPHVQLQSSNETKYEYWCSGFAARINSDFSTSDGVGDYACNVNVYVPAGTWTIDGWIEYDENSDGLSWQGPVYVGGSPSVVF